MMQNARALAITISELLKEKQRGGRGGGGVKLPTPLTAPPQGPPTTPLLPNLNRGGR